MGIRDLFKRREDGIYALLKSDHWITIHGGTADWNTDVHTGRHVLLDGEGRIIGGSVPKELHGKNIKHAFRHMDKEDKKVKQKISVGDSVTYQRPGKSKKLSGEVTGKSGDMLTVSVKGSIVKVPVSHVVEHIPKKPEAPNAEQKQDPKRQRKNPFNREPEGGWTDADRVPAHLQQPSEAARHILHEEERKKESKHKVGTQIHYTGDQANHSGTFEVDKIHHFEGNPYYDLKEVGGKRRFNHVGEYQIHDEKHAGTRFIPKDKHDKERERLTKETEEKNRKFLEEKRVKMDSAAETQKEQQKPKIVGPFSEMDASRYNNTTHWPTSADKLNQQHNEQVQADRERAMTQLKRYGVDAMPSDVQDALKRLAGAHEHFVREQIRSREVAPPWTVTGRAKYNGRPDKADAITRNALDKVESAKKNLERTLKQYSPNRPVSSDESDAVQQLQTKIDEAQKVQNKYKQINSVVRKKKLTDEQKVEEMMKLGIGEKLARQAVEPDYMGRKGIPSYMLQNNLANIKRMQGRVEELSRKRSDSSSTHEFDDGIIHDNVDGNRVQIFFDGKPDADVRQKMKSRGFHWSSTAEGPNGEKGAWQRMRSPEALRIAKEITRSKEGVNKSMSGIRSYLNKSKKYDAKYQNPDGTFKNGFDGAVEYFMHVKGYSKEEATKIAGKIAAEKGEAGGHKKSMAGVRAFAKAKKSHRYAYKTNHRDPIYIPVNRIRDPYQTEKALSEDKIRENMRRMKAGEPLEPIVIGYGFPNKDGERDGSLADCHDGHHRIEAAKRLGHTHVPCIVGGTNKKRIEAADRRYREVWKSRRESTNPPPAVPENDDENVASDYGSGSGLTKASKGAFTAAMN